MKENYQLIDLAKLFFAICVVAIHSQFLLEYKFGYYVNTNIYRLAVPFFFICNGYFLAKSDDLSRENNRDRLIKIIKKYIFWCLLYTFIYNIFVVWNFNYHNLIQDIVRVFTLTSTNIMWYLGVLLVFTLLICYIKDDRKLKYIFYISILGYLVGLSFTTYKYVFIGTNYEIFVNYLDKLFTSNRYFLFTIMYPLIGNFMYKSKIFNKVTNVKLFLILIISQVFLLIETSLFYNYSLVYNEYDYFLFKPIVVVFLFSLLSRLNVKSKINSLGFRNLSNYLFFYHYIFIYLFHFLDRISYSQIYGTNNIIIWIREKNFRMFVYVLLSTLVLSLVLSKRKKVVKRSGFNG